MKNRTPKHKKPIRKWTTTQLALKNRMVQIKIKSKATGKMIESFVLAMDIPKFNRHFARQQGVLLPY